MRISDWSSYVCSSDLSHIVITTIMFNFIAAAVMVWLLVDHFSLPGTMQPETRTFESGGTLPKLTGLFALFGADAGGRSEERRAGKECVSTGRSRGSRNH